MVQFLMVLLCSVVFSVSSLALCPAIQGVCGVLLKQDFVTRWSPCVAIVSRAWYHTWRRSLSGAGPVDRRFVAHASMQTSLSAIALPHRSTRLRRPLLAINGEDASASSSTPWTAVSWSSSQHHQHAAHHGRSR